MQIYIDGHQAVLKKGTSFEFVAENRLFSGSDGYTLSITFPLRGCAQNIAIFGNINRADVVAQNLIYECEIRDRKFSKFGCITITEVSEVEVKAQFLEGRSVQNFDKTFDNVYINELYLGEPDGSVIPSPVEAWTPSFFNNEYVALPWCNNSAGVLNNVPVHEHGNWKWATNFPDLSYQPYLLYIAKQICRAVKYDFDFSQWEEHEQYKYLLVCNTLPHSWERPSFAAVMPHWTVDEFFEKLELFLNGEFVIDHKAGKISFAFTEQLLSSLPDVRIDNVVDEHSANITVDSPNCEYLYAKNIVFADCDHELWKYQSCDWFIKSFPKPVLRFKTVQELIDSCKVLKHYINDTWHVTNPSIENLLYAEDVDAYFMAKPYRRSEVQPSGLRTGSYQFDCVLQPINMFGGRIVDDDEKADSVEIDFVPVRIDRIDEEFGTMCMFLDCGELADADSEDPLFANLIMSPHFLKDIRIGEKEKSVEFFDKVYLGFWDGNILEQGKIPYPYVEDVIISDDWETVIYTNCSVRLNNRYLNVARSESMKAVDVKRSVTFKFLSDTIPDVRAVFNIHGKRYLCEKITATFTENGMSQLLKGVFWPII